MGVGEGERKGGRERERGQIEKDRSNVSTISQPWNRENTPERHVPTTLPA